MDGNALITAPDSALLTLEYDNGAQGTIHVSAVADPVANQYIAIYGEEGTLDVKFAISGPNAGVVIQGRRHDDEAMNILEIPDDIWGQFDDENVMAYFENHAVGPRLFVDSIINDSPVSPNFYDGFKVQEVVDAAFRSHESGSWVSIPQSKSYV